MKALLSKVVFPVFVAALVFVLGFVAGYSYHSTGELKADLKANTTVAQTNAQSVAAAQTASVKIEGKIEKTAAAIDLNKSAIHQRVTAQIQRHAEAASTYLENHDETTSFPDGSPTCGGFYLDVGTVRMLNASRQGTVARPAGSLDEAGDAAPALCFTDFIDADQDLTKLYLDLSVRHDALVDSVEEFQAKQRERLGIATDPAQ
jgi:hypothetical protein